MTSEPVRGDDMESLEQRLFDVCAYLANSAALSLAETPSLAAFRMVDAVHRLVDLAHEMGPAADGFYAEVAADYAAHRNAVMQDQEAFDRWLPSFGASFTTEAVRRARQPPPWSGSGRRAADGAP